MELLFKLKAGVKAVSIVTKCGFKQRSQRVSELLPFRFPLLASIECSFEVLGDVKLFEEDLVLR